MNEIPYGRQCIDDEDIRAVAEVLKSDFLTTGPKAGEFERAVCDYTGASYAAALSNGTAALHAACFAAGIGKGDEVITSPITFAASANCVRYCGGMPVFADIDPETMNISPAEIEKKITGRTKAVIAVHFAGLPCAMDEIHAVAKKYGLLVIEDAAHALGASYHGKKIGTLSDMTTFSFHPVKHITTGEGGMVLTENPKLHERIVRFRTHGITRDARLLSTDEGPWYYEQLELGYNYRISDLQCALGISQLKKLPDFLEKRRQIAARYDAAFSDCPAVVLPPSAGSSAEHAYHLYVIRVKSKTRRAVFEALRAAGIGVNVHYVPVYHFPDYRNNGYETVCCPNAEAYYSACISLPVYPLLTQAQQEYVITQVKKQLSALPEYA